jgi:hypothetical protein
MFKFTLKNVRFLQRRIANSMQLFLARKQNTSTFVNGLSCHKILLGMSVFLQRHAARFYGTSMETETRFVKSLANQQTDHTGGSLETKSYRNAEEKEDSYTQKTYSRSSPFRCSIFIIVGTSFGCILILLVALGILWLYDYLDVVRIKWKFIVKNISPASMCFGRDFELTRLSKLFQEKPEFIEFLGGVPGAGLSTIIQHSLSNNDYNSILIDLRQFGPLTEPRDFVVNLNKALGAFEALSVRYFLREFLMREIHSTNREALQIERLKTILQKLTVAIRYVMHETPTTTPYPIVCIDHCEELWPLITSHSQVVDVFLKWAFWITHEAHLAHVVFATTDAQTLQALQSYGSLPPNYAICFNVSEIDKNVMKLFLAHHLKETRQLNEKEIDKIWIKVSGRFTDLLRIVTLWKSDPSLHVDQVLQQIERSTLQKVLEALEDNKSNEWKPEQLWETMRRLVSCGENNDQLPYFELLEEVFKGDVNALRQLCQRGLLLLRPVPSPHMKPLPTAHPIISSYSQMTFHCFKSLVTDWNTSRLMEEKMKRHQN